jgi:pimeloyl-ACP methyl ester carboxylesterase
VARFVFVHGAWHGGWCFDPVAAELERRGHEAGAPDLPCDRPGLSVHDYAAVVGSEPDAVVVGHSLGGLTIPFVRARARVFLAGLVPVDGVYAEALSPDFTGTVRDELGRSVWPDFQTTREKLYPDLDPDRARAAFERLRPQAPLRPEPVELSGPCETIVTMRDRVVRPEWQLETARAVLGVEPLELDAGHSPFITHPVELAGLLEWVASR